MGGGLAVVMALEVDAAYYQCVATAGVVVENREGEVHWLLRSLINVVESTVEA